MSPHLPVLLGPLTILTLTYEREQSAFLCFYIKDSKQNVSNNTNVFPYSLGHQKLKGYCWTKSDLVQWYSTCLACKETRVPSPALKKKEKKIKTKVAVKGVLLDAPGESVVPAGF